MEIAIQILKNRLQNLINDSKEYKDGNTYLEELKKRISEVQYLIQRLEIEGRRMKIEEKEFQDSLGRL
tara:strand:- start:55 stop:258 length:204 start_codon:yes stop_codon:yes gene_type:complete